MCKLHLRCAINIDLGVCTAQTLNILTDLKRKKEKKKQSSAIFELCYNSFKKHYLKY